MSLHPESANEALRVLSIFATVLPHLGEPSILSDFLALRESFRLRVCRDPSLRVPYLITRGADGTSVIWLRDDEGTPVLPSFLTAQEAARHFLPFPRTDARRCAISRQAADLVAAFVTFGRAESASACTDGLTCVRPTGWYATHWQAIDAIRRDVLGPVLSGRLGRPGRHGDVDGLRPGARALAAGRSLRDRARYAAARRLFRFAIAAASEEGEWEIAVRGYVGLGKTLKLQGTFPKARKALVTGVRVARSHGVTGDARAFLYHDLATLAIEACDRPRARALAAAALRHYPAGSEYRLQLAHDIACLWLEEGQFRPALTALTAVLGAYSASDPRRMLVAANVARAAAGCGDGSAFQAAWDLAWTAAMAGAPQSPEHARTFLHLALGAHTLQLWRQAGFAAELAVEIATRHGEHRVEAFARAALSAIETHSAAQVRTQAAEEQHDVAFATQLVRALAA
jgi:hypothetical protein